MIPGRDSSALLARPCTVVFHKGLLQELLTPLGTWFIDVLYMFTNVDVYGVFAAFLPFPELRKAAIFFHHNDPKKLPPRDASDVANGPIQLLQSRFLLAWRHQLSHQHLVQRNNRMEKKNSRVQLKTNERNM